MLDDLQRVGFDVLTLHHAGAILLHDMPEALAEVSSVLVALQIPVLELVSGGGGEARPTQRMRQKFAELGWTKRTITIRKFVNFDGVESETQSLSHEIDHVKRFSDHTVALEIEWNNKDPFFDRDLENFKRLHAEGVISLGVIITRGRSLQDCLHAKIREFADDRGIDGYDGLKEYGYEPTTQQRREIERRAERSGFRAAWVDAFVASKFGRATTHWDKLADRVSRGVGNPCPLLLIGIPESVVVV